MAGEAVPHVLLFPFPIQGHVPPMLMIAEILHQLAEFHITLVNTEYYHQHLLKNSPEAMEQLSRQPRFRFCTVPDGLPEDNPRAFLSFLDLEESMRRRSREPYRDLLLAEGNAGWPKVTCVVADAIQRVAVEVAVEVEIPVVILRTCSASSFWVNCCIPKLIQLGELPFPENADMDKLVQGVPGTETFLRRRDLPSFCRKPLFPDNRPLEFLMTLPSIVKQGDALILNTFHSLDSPTLSNIRAHLFPLPTFAIGPLHLLSRTISSSPMISFWQDDNDCIQWLNSQPPKSVIYVSFGSIAVISITDLLELWHGVVNSGKRFLWVVRQDLEEMETELGEVSAERGCIVRWAPQEEVLAHPAVGCFLTHAGWNSTLESIAAGVPMICWPFFSDQQTNSRFVSVAWNVGVDMKDVCDRRVVEEMVREVMEGEGGEEVRRAASEMGQEAQRIVVKGGSSYVELLGLIQQIRELSSKMTSKCKPNK